MDKIIFKNNQEPALNETNLNLLQDNMEKAGVIVSATTPITGEKVWLKKDSVLGDKIFCKNENNWEEFKMLNDTGWIDMSQYVNTEYFAPRPGIPPMARKIGKVVYWMGYVYCIKDSTGWALRIMQNLPEWARCDSEFSRGFVMWESWISGSMLMEDDHILIGQNTEIKSVGEFHWRAYSLGTISGYISKGE